jgi:hypothetical protein
MFARGAELATSGRQQFERGQFFYCQELRRVTEPRAVRADIVQKDG